jgi:ankyrin repeat protein
MSAKVHLFVPVARRFAQMSDALLAASREGDRERALALLDERTGIEGAAVAGDADAVAAALEGDGSAAAAADAHGWTPLLYACASPVRGDGVARCVELLLDHGANRDRARDDGRTP